MIAFSAPARYIVPLCIRISTSGAGAQGVSCSATIYDLVCVPSLFYSASRPVHLTEYSVLTLRNLISRLVP
jgi:hypothetical protein